MKRVSYFYQTLLLTLAVFLLTTVNATAQEREPLNPNTAKTALTPATIVSPFEVTSEKSDLRTVVKDATYLKLNVSNLKNALKKQPREMVFQIPQKDGSKLELLLEKQEILTPDFMVTNEKGVEIPWEGGQFYAGKVLSRGKSDETSVAALSITGDEIMAMMNVNGENLVLGTLRDDRGKTTSSYVLYNDHKLQIANNFTCGSTVENHLMDNPSTVQSSALVVGKNVVRVYFEADYRTYQDKGNSVANVANYVTGLFNMVATIYQNEGIVTQISQIFVWTTPDPYPISSANGSGAVLDAFKTAKNGGFNGDLAHLISTKPVGHGGIAWIDVLCHPTIGYRTAYSNISTTYNNFPLYSWTIDVVTHEMGHNLGSPHTHDCVWGAAANQALDNCYTTSGGCPAGPAPTNGGTIMSYCHLTSAGKNFNLGFGAQPGNKIRSKVAAATCLTKAFLDCGSATPIYCGTPVNGTTIGAVNNVTTYGCISWNESGPEKVYMLQTTEPGSITATLSNLTADLDVIILDACSESNCLAEGNNSATVVNASPGMYFIVVDGYGGAAGNFTLTVNCNGPCFTTGLTNFEYIQRVKMGAIDNNSGNNYGYAAFTNLVTPVHRGGTVDVSLTPGFISGAWNESWGIWIDINHDNDFNDYGELVYTSPAASSTTVNGTVAIPSWAELGQTRMRVAMRFGSLPTACGTFSGEVEDYTVDIQPYCPSLGNSKYEFIQTVAVGSLVNDSGDNSGYGDFTSLPALELLKGDTVSFKLIPGFTGTVYPEGWSIWIDLNQDFVFDDATELLFQTSPVVGVASGSFEVPTSAFTGETRMRITMWYGSPAGCSYAFYGETEDYTVNITPFCASAGNSTYEFIQTAGIGTLLNDSGNDGGYADFTDLVADVTAGAPTGIVLIPGFSESSYSEYWRVWVDLNKNKIFEDSEQIFEAGPNDGLVFGAFILPDTTPVGKYGCRVSMKYGGFPDPCGDFAWGEVEDYTLEVIGETGGGDFGGLSDRSDDNTSNFSNVDLPGDFNLYPNPVRDLLNIEWIDMQPIAGQVVSPTGQVLYKFDESSVPSRLDVANLPSGIYMLQAVSADNKVMVKRFIKAE